MRLPFGGMKNARNEMIETSRMITRGNKPPDTSSVKRSGESSNVSEAALAMPCARGIMDTERAIIDIRRTAIENLYSPGCLSLTAGSVGEIITPTHLK